MRLELDWDDESLDFSLVHADDALVDQLGSVEGPDPWVTRRDRLAQVLLVWRLDVDAEPIGDLTIAEMKRAREEAA
jgi:hypothetical protein